MFPSMICRLCLDELGESITIFEDRNHTTDCFIAKIVAKYLNIEISATDFVSNKICKSCWAHLNGFHSFWLHIDEKQQDLQARLYNIKSVVAKGAEEGKGNVNPYQEEDNKLVFPREPCSNVNPSNDSQQKSLRAIAADGSVTDVHKKAESDSSNSDQTLTFINVISNSKSVKEVSRQGCNNGKEESRILEKRCKLRLKRTQRFDMEGYECEQRKTACNANTIRMEHDAFIAQHATLSCCICNQSIQNFAELKRHFQEEHQCSAYVICCNSRFSQRTLYVDHLKLHNNPDLFKCKECDKVLANRNSFQNHMHSCHPQEEALKFECTFCAKKFAKQYILDYHLNTHRTSEKKHICGICQKGYRSDSEMKQHQKRVHFTAFTVICDICGKHFKSKQSFQKHSEVVHLGAIRPEAECTICGKWLKDDSSLHKHMYKHRDESSGKEFTCSKCGVVKTTRQTLKSHMRYHHPEKLQKCSLCSKEFKRILALEEHMATHTGQALYTCNFCPQTFKSHANMHNHKKKLHPTQWVRKYSRPSNVAAEEIQID